MISPDSPVAGGNKALSSIKEEQSTSKRLQRTTDSSVSGNFILVSDFSKNNKINE
jgi:hypothetical protein